MKHVKYFLWGLLLLICTYAFVIGVFMMYIFFTREVTFNAERDVWPSVVISILIYFGGKSFYHDKIENKKQKNEPIRSLKSTRRLSNGN